MEKIESRKRSFNINNLDPVSAEQLSQDIGAKIREICDAACAEANKILNVYGMKAQMQIVIEENKVEAPKPAKKKRGRPRKDTQSLS